MEIYLCVKTNLIETSFIECVVKNFFESESKCWIYIQTNICITRLLNRCVQAVNESYLDFTNLRLHTDNEYIHL